MRLGRRLKVKQRLGFGTHSDYLASTSTPTSPPLCHPNEPAEDTFELVAQDLEEKKDQVSVVFLAMYVT